MGRLVGRIVGFLVLVAVGAGGAALYSQGRGEAVEAIYRDRLNGLLEDHRALQSRYDEAVEKTAVTEILVTEEGLSLVLRTVEGVEKRIETDLDPRREVHVDYVVRDGRLFIRRIYDDRTPPADAQVIDPLLAEVDWLSENMDRGLTVYRGQLEPGRWVVSTTGNGALDLVKSDTPVRDLSSPPVIRDYDQVQEEIGDEIAEIGTLEVWTRLTNRFFKDGR